MRDEEKNENPRKMSNLIEEKDELGKELSTAKKKIEELEMNQHDLITLNNQLKLSLNGFKVFGVKGNSIKANAKITIPALDFTSIKRPGDKPIISEAGYVHKLEESIKYLSKRTQELEDENRELLQKDMQLQNSNINLLKLNTTLSNSMQDLREQLGLLKKKSPTIPIAAKYVSIQPGDRLISTPSIMKQINNRSRQVTDYMTNPNMKAGNRRGNSSYCEVTEDPNIGLRINKTAVGSSEKESGSGTGEKDQSFGDVVVGHESEKNVNAGGEGKDNE